MPNQDLSTLYFRLRDCAALLGEFHGLPDRQAEVAGWVLEALAAVCAREGLEVPGFCMPVREGVVAEPEPPCAAADAALNPVTGHLEMVGTCQRCGHDRAHHLRTGWRDCRALAGVEVVGLDADPTLSDREAAARAEVEDAERERLEEPTFPTALVCPKHPELAECEFRRAGFGWQCHGYHCRRYVHPGDPGFAELTAFYAAVEAEHAREAER